MDKEKKEKKDEKKKVDSTGKSKYETPRLVKHGALKAIALCD